MQILIDIDWFAILVTCQMKKSYNAALGVELFHHGHTEKVALQVP